MKSKDIYIPTGIDMMNMILRMYTSEFNRHDTAKVSIPTMLTQADKVVNEKEFFILRDEKDG